MAEVLVADDDGGIRDALRMVLEYTGYTVHEATDGADALTALRASAHGMVVVLDYLMPRLDGHAVLRTIAADPALRQRHSVVMMTASGNSMPATLVELLTALGASLVTKPFDLDQI